jgi:undecaprenyl-diphosphatase
MRREAEFILILFAKYLFADIITSRLKRKDNTMSIWEAIALGIVQGLTEFLPVSSSGHLVLLQKIFGTAALEGTTNPQLLFFDTMLHIGTLIAVVVVLWKDVLGLFKKPFKSLLYLVIATIPAVIFTLWLSDFIGNAFGGQYLGFAFLFTALLLVTSELIARRVGNRRELRLGSAAVMGVMQAIAILPGISRSGSTIAGGLACGVERQKVARFAFLMSIPAIIGGALFNGYAAVTSKSLNIQWAPMLLGMACAAITGYIAIRFMLALISKKRLWGFAIYVAAVGAFVLLDQTVLHIISW